MQNISYFTLRHLGTVASKKIMNTQELLLFLRITAAQRTRISCVVENFTLVVLLVDLVGSQGIFARFSAW